MRLLCDYHFSCDALLSLDVLDQMSGGQAAVSVPTAPAVGQKRRRAQATVFCHRIPSVATSSPNHKVVCSILYLGAQYQTGKCWFYEAMKKQYGGKRAFDLHILCDNECHQSESGLISVSEAARTIDLTVIGHESGVDHDDAAIDIARTGVPVFCNTDEHPDRSRLEQKCSREPTIVHLTRRAEVVPLNSVTTGMDICDVVERIWQVLDPAYVRRVLELARKPHSWPDGVRLKSEDAMISIYPTVNFTRLGLDCVILAHAEGTCVQSILRDLANVKALELTAEGRYLHKHLCLVRGMPMHVFVMIDDYARALDDEFVEQIDIDDAGRIDALESCVGEQTLYFPRATQEQWELLVHRMMNSGIVLARLYANPYSETHSNGVAVPGAIPRTDEPALSDSVHVHVSRYPESPFWASFAVQEDLAARDVELKCVGSSDSRTTGLTLTLAHRQDEKAICREIASGVYIVLLTSLRLLRLWRVDVKSVGDQTTRGVTELRREGPHVDEEVWKYTLPNVYRITRRKGMLECFANGLHSTIRFPTPATYAVCTPPKRDPPAPQYRTFGECFCIRGDDLFVVSKSGPLHALRWTLFRIRLAGGSVVFFDG